MKVEIKKTEGSKRLNLCLDQVALEKLNKIREIHGDSSYTQAIKRAIAFLEFIDSKREDGLDVYLGEENGTHLTGIINMN